MRQALSVLLLTTLLAPLFPLSLVAQEIGSSTPPTESSEVAPLIEEEAAPVVVDQPPLEEEVEEVFEPTVRDGASTTPQFVEEGNRRMMRQALSVESALASEEAVLYRQVSAYTSNGTVAIGVRSTGTFEYQAGVSYTPTETQVMGAVSFVIGRSGERAGHIHAEVWYNGTRIAVSEERDVSEFSTYNSINASQEDFQAGLEKFVFTTPLTLLAGENYQIVAGAGDDLSGYLDTWVSFTPAAYPVAQQIYANSAFREILNANFVLYGVATGTLECFENCNSNVMFLPGIEGSRLYRPDYSGGTDKLWEPGVTDDGNDDLRDMFLTLSGTGIRSDIYALKGDIIGRTPANADIYDSFIQKMDVLKAAGTIADWEPIAYDWRLSLNEILQSGHEIDGRIYYTGDLSGTSTPYIIQELRRLAASSNTGKVTIIAHSNGGLLAKALTEALGAEAEMLIDKMIFVAVPQAGSPNAVASGLHGYDQNLAWGLINSKQTARAFASTSPMFYHLLPSAGYFTYVDDPVVTFDSTLPEWRSRYGASIHSEETLDQFLTDTFGRVPATGNENQPIQLSQSLKSAANTLHDDIDVWAPPEGVDLVQIAGWGVDRTLSGISYTKKGTGVEPELIQTIDGDGTVPVPSALWVGDDLGAQNIWLDLAKYNSFSERLSNGRVGSASHGNILSISELLDYVSDALKNSPKNVEEYKYLSASSPLGEEKRLRYSLHSPLKLDLYDNEGRHTGVSETGEIDEEIPGTYYSELGDVKYLFVDPSVAGNIVMNGYATGTFTFKIEQLKGDTVSGSVAYSDIPTTPSTVARIQIQEDISGTTPLLIDQNGDGQTDTYVAKDGGVLTLAELITNLRSTVQSLIIKDKLKTQLLNKITNIEQKISKQKQKQSNILTKLKNQLDKKAGKGKIDAATAAQISVLLDDLITQSATIPLDSSLLQQLKDQINTVIDVKTKTALLVKVARLETLSIASRSLADMTKVVTNKGSKGLIPDADVQNLLNLLDQIQGAI